MLIDFFYNLINFFKKFFSKREIRILRSGKLESFYAMPLKVDFRITYMCNYHCSYCYGQEKIDRSKFSKLDELERCIDVLHSLNRNAYDFTITGGEPTAHPHFYDLLEILTKNYTTKSTISRLYQMVQGKRPFTKESFP